MAEAPPYYIADPNQYPGQPETTVIGGVTYVKDPKTGYWIAPSGAYGVIEPGKNPYTGAPDPSAPASFSALPQWQQPDGVGGSGSSGRLSTDDPRYWDFQYQQLASEEKRAADSLAAQYANMGLDAEASRRQALTTLITNRNNGAIDIYKTAGEQAAQAAQFAANPRDAMTDLFFRNAMGNATPNGDSSGAAGDARQKGFFDRFNEIFGGLAGDKARAVDFISAIPTMDYLQPAAVGPAAAAINPNTPVPASPMPAPQGAPAPNNDTAGALQFLQAMQDPQKATDFRKWVTGGQYQAPASAAKGGSFNFDDIFDNRGRPGASPTSSEGGLNMNIHERAVIVGESGQVYGTLGERRPDGSVRAENLIIKPLKSEVAKDKAMEESGKQAVESQGKTLAGFKSGGSVASIPKPSDFLEELRKNLGMIGGSGGNATGYDSHTGIQPLRTFAGAPWERMSPTQREYLYAAQSAAGVSPEEVDWTVKQFTPNAPINNFPRVTW